VNPIGTTLREKFWTAWSVLHRYGGAHGGSVLDSGSSSNSYHHDALGDTSDPVPPLAVGR